ncbi:MAG: SapC family protein [Pseudomonadales bacterium]|nr:SapC family protein [Pseudomonadales bacterium]
MASLLFYNKPVALNKTIHKDVKISTGSNNFSFAAETNSVILAGVEFTQAAKEYPIVFAKAGDGMVPVALLGLRNEENLFLTKEGVWEAKYVPAFIRRYPFVLAESKEPGQRMVCIDESYSGFEDKEGEPLFQADGEPAPILQQAIEFLEEYQKQYIRTERFIQRLQENDLLMPLNAKIDMVDGQQFALTGLLAVDEQKLLALSDEKALELFKSGELAWVYCHLMSMGNMAALVDRIAKLDTPETTEGASDDASVAEKKAKKMKEIQARKLKETQAKKAKESQGKK